MNEKVNEQGAENQVVSPSQLVIRRFLRSKLAVFGVCILVVITLFSVVGPIFVPYGEYEQFFAIETSYDAKTLQALVDRGTIDMDTQINTLHKEKNVQSKILKSEVDVPGKEIYTVGQAIEGVIPADKDPEQRYRLYNVSFQDKEKKELVQDGFTTDKEILLYSQKPISSDHLLGTDKDGNDVFTRLMYGGRISLMIGLICVLIELLIGVTLGGIAGYCGGIIDAIIMRIVDIMNSIPTFPVIILINSGMRAMEIAEDMKIFVLMLVIGLLSWPGVARMVRGQILSLREQEFMVATEATGIKPSRRIFRHLLPNVMPQLIVSATLGVGSVILLESALSFLGLGVSTPYSTWGIMINSVTDQNIMMNCLNVWVPPGLAILFTVMAINFVGDGLRDAFDPKMKR